MTHAQPRVRSVLGAAMMSAAVLASLPFAVHGQSSPVALTHESQFIARVQELTEPQLKSFYVSCSREAERRVLGFGEAAMCSIGYETLLKRSFGGDFLALFAWSKAQADGAVRALD